MLSEEQRSAMRAKLMESAVSIVAREGYHKATTKNIAAYSGLNEVYIYRLFADKEALILRAFAICDGDIARAAEKALPLLGKPELSLEQSCRLVMHRVCEQLLADRDRAKFYVRYYHSEQYQAYAAAGHIAAYQKVIEGLAGLFKQGEDVSALLRFAFESVICMVYRLTDEEADSRQNTMDIYFRLLYSALTPSLVKAELQSAVEPLRV